MFQGIGETKEETGLLCLEAGMDEYVSKPINPRMLVETLGRWLPGGDAA